MSFKKPCQSVRRSKYDPGIWFVNSEEWQASVALFPPRNSLFQPQSSVAFWFCPLPLTKHLALVHRRTCLQTLL